MLGRQRPVSDERKEIVGLPDAGVGHRLGEGLAFHDRLDRQIVSAQLLLEHLPSEVDGARPLLEADQVFDFVACVRCRDVVQPVAAWLVAGRGHDLDDVAVLKPRAKGNHLAVDARADALMTDVGVNGVREIDRRRAARKPLTWPLGVKVYTSSG